MYSTRHGSAAPRVPLIVGAGPTGLTLATELLRRGVACRIIDASVHPAAESRALVEHARTLELWQTRGLLDEALARGSRMYGFSAYSAGRRIIHFSLRDIDSPFPFDLVLPQCQVEQLLLGYLQRLGGSVERGVRFTSLDQEGDTVVAVLQHEDGRREDVSSPWLVGCDGGSSAVRRSLGLSFDGRTGHDPVALADVRIEWDFSRDESLAFLSPDGCLGVIPIPDSRHRLMLQLPPANGDSPASASLDMFQEAMDRSGPRQRVRISDPAWMATFRIQHRIAPTCRAGRVFLAGDAAHIQSPFGGQGMNNGIMDACNLAWKLALVMGGVAAPRLLDSYDAERRRMAIESLKRTEHATRLIQLRHPMARHLRDHACRALCHIPAVRRSFATAISQIGLNYRGTALVEESPARGGPTRAGWRPIRRARAAFAAGPRAGDRVPDGPVTDARTGTPRRLLDVLQGIEHHLLIFTGTSGERPAANVLATLVHAIGQRAGIHIRPHVVASTKDSALPRVFAGSVLDDGGLVLHRRYGARRPCLYVIRPDGYIAFRGDGVVPQPLMRHLDRSFAPCAPAPNGARADRTPSSRTDVPRTELAADVR